MQTSKKNYNRNAKTNHTLVEQNSACNYLKEIQ